MDFDLGDEQQLFRDTIDRLVERAYGFEQRQRYAAEAPGYSREVWAQMAELGLLALPVAEDDGGLGFGAQETALVMEAAGRGLMLEPYLASVVLAGSLLRGGASTAQRGDWLPGLIDGSVIWTLATTERGSRWQLSHVETRATRDGDGWRLDGEKIAVPHGHVADQALVSARIAGEAGEARGIAVFRVAADADGLTRRSYRTQDGQGAADWLLDGVRVAADDWLAVDEALPLLEAARDAGIAALAAEAVGAMQALLDLSVDYLGQRKQFGGVIGRFQVLQHMAVDMLVELEQARSMAMLAAMAIDGDDADARRRTLAAVKVQLGRALRLVGQTAVQLHGGIGVTEESAVGHYFRRLTMIDLQFGDGDHHLDRLVALGGLGLGEAPAGAA